MPSKASDRSRMAMTSLETVGRQSDGACVARVERASYAEVRELDSFVALRREREEVRKVDTETGETGERGVAPLRETEKCGDKSIVVGANGTRLGSSVAKLFGEVHDGPTAVADDARGLLEARDEGGDERGKVGVEFDGLDENVCNATESPGGGVADLCRRVGHHLDEDWQCLRDEGSQDLLLRTVKDGAERHDGGFAVPPIGALDVPLDEWDDGRDDAIADTLCEESEARSGRHRDVPLVVGRVLVLLRQKQEKDGQDLG